MPASKPNPRRAKIHRNYEIAEIATLFGVHRNTVRAWLKAGLPTVDDGRPALVMGRDLVRFLEQRRQAARRPCGPDQMYCLRCREPRQPEARRVVYRPLSASQGNLVGRCGCCGTGMYRRVSLVKLVDLQRHFDLRGEVGDEHLVDAPGPSLHCDFNKERPDHAHTPS